MLGATPANADIAVQKASTAALTRRSSKMWEDRVAAGRIVMMKMPVLPVQGGLPIISGGVCVGGVGVSGVQSHQDEQIAAAGIRAVTQE
jgi:glc operon protein GlcG